MCVCVCVCVCVCIRCVENRGALNAIRDERYEQLALEDCNVSYLAKKKELEELHVPDLLVFSKEEALLLARYYCVWVWVWVGVCGCVCMYVCMYHTYI